MRIEPPLIAGILLLSAFARADAIYLQGGRVLEGTATVDGDKVTVELESGRMAFARSEVVRIEQATAPLDEADRREKQLGRNDVAGMLELANYCRDHGLPARERALLERVLAREPNHADARHRLGFVREAGRWVPRSEQLRKERLAQQQQRDHELARKRQQLELEEATLRRDRAELELKRAETRATRERSAPVAQPSSGWYGPVVVAPTGHYWNNGWNQRAPYPQPWTAPGARDAHVPQGDNFINGARSPQSYFDDAYRAAYGRSPPR